MNDEDFARTLVLGNPFTGGRLDTRIPVPVEFNKFMAGAGKSVADTGMGMKQLGATVADFVSPRRQTLSGLITGAPVSRSEAVQREIDEMARRDEPLMSDTAGFLGNVAGQMGQYAVGAAPARGALNALARGNAGVLTRGAQLLNRSPFASGAAGGATFAGLQPTASNQSTATNMLWGGVGGGAGNWLGARLAGGARPATERPLAGDLSPYDLGKRAAQDYGVGLRRGQHTGGQHTEGIGKLPLAGRQASNDRIVEQWSRAVSRTMGEDTPNAVEAVARARSNLSRTYNQLANRYGLRLNVGDTDSIEGAIRAMGDTSPVNPATGVRQLTERMTAELDNLRSLYQQHGNIPGREYQRLRSRFSAMSQDPDVGGVYRTMRDTLDNAMTREINVNGTAADAQLWWQTNQRWRAMRAAERGMPTTDPNGPFDPDRLYRGMMSNTRRNRANQEVAMNPESVAPNMPPGTHPVKDLGYLANIGVSHIRSLTTPERLLNPHTAMAAGAAAAGAGGLFAASESGLVDPHTALGLGVGMAGLGLTAGRLANRPASPVGMPNVGNVLSGAQAMGVGASAPGAMVRAQQARGAPPAPPAPGAEDFVPDTDLSPEMLVPVAPAVAPAAQR